MFVRVQIEGVHVIQNHTSFQEIKTMHIGGHSKYTSGMLYKQSIPIYLSFSNFNRVLHYVLKVSAAIYCIDDVHGLYCLSCIAITSNCLFL